jgi:hypothetical protein
MREHEASRTLVKSPPELWSECSDAASLARHLGEFAGEIRITRLDPETTVAWEGERTSGTVRIEPSGWGTRVTLTAAAQPAEADATEATSGEDVGRPNLPTTPPRRTRLAWLKSVFLGDPEGADDPQPADEQGSPSEQTPGGEVTAALDSALDSLGQAHHRPYSRG